MGILLIEPAIVPDIFCSGITAPEDLGNGNLRYTAFAQQQSFRDQNGGVDYVIVNRLIVPSTVVMASIQATMKVMGFACCGGERLKLRH